jgi:ADP-heptose:LPS heptosyltransferase
MNTAKIIHAPIERIDFSGLQRIAVFRALQLGDLLCTVPALRALRAAAPQAEITLIGLPWAAEFARRFDRYIDDFIAFPGFPGMPEAAPDFAGIPNFFSAAQEKKFDLVIQMHGSGTLSNPLAAALGARCNAGFYVPGQYCPDPHRFVPWAEKEHEVLRYLRLMSRLGVANRGDALEFPLHDDDFRVLRDSGADLPAPGTYVCIHPGARLPSRRWPPVRFAEVADRLAAQGLHIVLTGAAQERELVDAVKQAMHTPAIDMCGRTSLGAAAALISQARLLVSNDTGVSHLAAAVGTPSVIVCCGADPSRWAPLNRQRHRVLHANVLCRPCAHEVCPIGHPCAKEVGASKVFAVAADLCLPEAVNRRTVT